MEVVAIVGSRTKTKQSQQLVLNMVETVLRDIPKDSVIISGGCGSGADHAARQLCEKQKRPYLEAPAWWGVYKSFDKSAGYKRNRTIVRVCTRLVAIWDQESPGTEHTINLAKTLGKPVKVLRFEHVQLSEVP